MAVSVLGGEDPRMKKMSLYSRLVGETVTQEICLWWLRLCVEDGLLLGMRGIRERRPSGQLCKKTVTLKNEKLKVLASGFLMTGYQNLPTEGPCGLQLRRSSLHFECPQKMCPTGHSQQRGVVGLSASCIVYFSFPIIKSSPNPTR